MSVENHPITARLTTPDSITTGNNGWEFQDYGIVYNPSLNQIKPIPNILDKIKSIVDPNNQDPDIGESRSNEIASSNQNENKRIVGGAYISSLGFLENGLDFRLQNVGTGEKNSIEILPLVQQYFIAVRPLATAISGNFNIILHGKNDETTIDEMGNLYGEYKYVKPRSTDPNILDDYWRHDSFIAFSTNASSTQALVSNQISFRKSQHHYYVSIPQSHINGLNLSNQNNGYSYLFLNSNLSSENTLIMSQFSIGSTCGFNDLSAESTSASRGDNTTPNIITCKYKFLKLHSVEQNTFIFQNVTGQNISLFTANTQTPPYHHSGTIQSNAPTDPPAQYTIPSNQRITIRAYNPINIGNKNLLAYRTDSMAATRLFGGSTNIGITAGSYIRIDGSESNDGIYQVLSVMDGIPGDNAYNSLSDGLPLYQYLELSRDIVPESENIKKDVVVTNISSVPILHVKYRTTTP